MATCKDFEERSFHHQYLTHGHEHLKIPSRTSPGQDHQNENRVSKRPLQGTNSDTTVSRNTARRWGISSSESGANFTQTNDNVPASAFAMLKNRRGDSAPYLIPPQRRSKLNPQSDWLQLGLGTTELAGEAGSGKSQLAMSLCVQAVLNSAPAPESTTRAIYISLAGGQASVARIAHRMQQMAGAEQQHRLQQQEMPTPMQPDGCDVVKQNPCQPHNPYVTTAQNPSIGQSDSQQSSQSVLSQILTHSIRNQDDLFSLLHNDLPRCLQQQKLITQQNSVALIVIDSIADLFRLGNGEDTNKDSTSISRRSFLLFELASLLRRLSRQYEVPVLVINQVSASLGSDSALPSLGLTWENCVNTSYFVSRRQSLSGSSVRQIQLNKSSRHAIHKRIFFQIETRGISEGQSK